MQNQNSNPKWITRVKKSITQWWSTVSVKFLEREVWTMRLNVLLGVCMMLIGFAIESKNHLWSYVFKGGGVAYAVKIILAFYKQALSRKKEETTSAQLWKKRSSEIRDFMSSLLQTYCGDLYDQITKNVEMTVHGAATIRRLGIIRIFRGLNLETILKDCCNTSLLLQRLYFSQKEFKVLMDHLWDLIVHKDCEVKILLLSPVEKEFLRKRRRSCSVYQKLLDHGVDQLADTIKGQLMELEVFRRGLPADKKAHLKVQIHADHAIGPVTASKHTVFAGLYMNEEMSEDGFQLEIAGIDTYAYQLWLSTFNIQWLHSWQYDCGIDEGDDPEPLIPVQANNIPDPPPLRGHSRIGKVLTLSECIDKTA